jgi:hypothetical protein
MDQDYNQPESDSGKAGASKEATADDNTREGTKEDIRSAEDEKAVPKVDTPDNLRDGTKN